MPRDADGHLTAGRLSPARAVPAHIARPEYAARREPRADSHGDVYTPAEVELIRESGRIAAGALETVAAAIRPGITTDELDAIAHDFVIERDAYPSTLQYRGFPKSCCTSLNEVVCHGIPDDTALVEGDILNIDITAYKNGMHGDLNATSRWGRWVRMPRS
jgi:methionyl aminopeptidase